MPTASWTVQQVAELLDAVAASQSTVEALGDIADVLDAELGVLILDEKIVEAFGYPRGQAPEDELLQLSRRAEGVLTFANLPQLGTINAVNAIIDPTTSDRITIGRINDPFTSGDVALIRGLARVIGTTRQLMNRAEAERHDALHDPLTGLPNRRLIIDRLGQAQRRAARLHNDPAVVFVDLNRFKIINDTLGHAAGDVALREISVRLQSVCRSFDTIGRLAGDEFVLVIENLDHDALIELADRIADIVSQPIELGGTMRTVTASYGIAVADQLTSPEDVLSNADVAMFEAKSERRPATVFFGSDMRERLVERVDMEHDLRAAIENHDLTVHYQPLITLSGRSIHGVEALVRWRRNDEQIPPDVFIPLAEDAGLVGDIGDFVLYEACAQVAFWRRTEPSLAHLGLSVNISAPEFEDGALFDRVGRALTESGLPSSALTLEMTETALMTDVEASSAQVNRLADLGVALAIDDFGTGYSSLSYLQNLPVSVLKIDRSFIRDVHDARTDRSIVESIIGMARGLGVDVMAEGIEEWDQLDVLRDLGCDLAQGFYFAHPENAEDALDLMLRLSGTTAAVGRSSHAPH